MKRLTAIAATAACAAALLALTLPEASAFYNDAYAKSRCENAVKIARGNNKVTDIRHASWKVQRVAYEKEGSRHDDGAELEYDRSKWVNYNQIHCFIEAECPATPWPHSSPASLTMVNGVAMYYDDPRRKWFRTEAYLSIAEVERVSCKGGRLRQ